MKAILNDVVDNTSVSVIGEIDYIESILEEFNEFDLNEKQKLQVIRGFRSTSHLYGIEFNIKVSN